MNDGHRAKRGTWYSSLFREMDREVHSMDDTSSKYVLNQPVFAVIRSKYST